MRLVLNLLIPFILVNSLFAKTTNISFEHTKEELIQKADNGNIQAMLELNKSFLFPQTKEGVELYKKWYKLVIKSKNSDEVVAFYKVYNKYYDLFINGFKKRKELLAHAVQLGNQEALNILLINYRYDTYNLDKLTKQIFKNPTQESLNTLLNYFIWRDDSYRLKKVKEFIKSNNFKEIIYLDRKKLNISNHKININANNIQKDKLAKYLDKLIALKNPKVLKANADYLYKKLRFKEAQRLYEKLLEYDDKNINTYYSLVKSCRKAVNFEKDQFEKKCMKYLKKAALLDDYNATKELLRIYVENEKYLDKYLSFKKQILKLNEAKRALAVLLEDTNNTSEAIKLYTQLAKNGNTNAILKLATKRFNKNTYNPEDHLLREKWQKFILDSKNPYLIEELRKASSWKYKKLDHLRAKLNKIQIEQKNIYVIRELYKYNKKKNKELANKYKDMLVKLGDTKILKDTARNYLLYTSEYQKAIDIYEKLANKNDIEAIHYLSSLYGTYSIFKKRSSKKFSHLKNLEKARFYYLKGANLGELNQLTNLAMSYLCGLCLNKHKYYKDVDEISAKKYIDKLIKLDDTRFINYLAGFYATGSFVKKDINKAIYYYKKLIEMKDDRAYKKLEELYKIQKKQ